MIKYTRLQYMNREVSHHEYYSQFCNSAVISLVDNRIGKKTIVDSKDPNFNDISLVRWDGLHGVIVVIVGKDIKEACNIKTGISLCDTVCIAKAAAQIIKEKFNKG